MYEWVRGKWRESEREMSSESAPLASTGITVCVCQKWSLRSFYLLCWGQSVKSKSVSPIFTRNMQFREKYQDTKNISHRIFYKNDSYKNTCFDHFDQVTALWKESKCRENVECRSSRLENLRKRVRRFEKSLYGLRVEFNANFEYYVSFN